MSVCLFQKSVRFGFTIILSLAPAMAFAERIIVRSGDHPGFTRLVLHLQKERTFKLETTTAEARLVLDGNGDNFDLTEAFRKIGTERIAAISSISEKNGLALSLNCECSVSAYQQGPQMIVVDVVDPPDQEISHAPLATIPSPNGGLPPLVISETKTRIARKSFAFPFAPLPNRPTVALGFGSVTVTEPIRSSNAGADLASPQDRSESDTSGAVAEKKHLSEAERRLAEQLSRAVSQGLVTPRAARLPKTSSSLPESNRHDDEDDGKAPYRTRPRKAHTPGLNLRAETSVDHDFSQIINSLPQNNDGAHCVKDSRIDVASWGSEGGFGEQIGKLRARLVGEFDRPNEKAALALTKAYIHFGFGAEALQVMHTAVAPDAEPDLLVTLARIMEFGHATAPDSFSAQYDCDTASAFWAILSQPWIPADAQVNTDAVLRGINSLPPHLRNHLGPILSERLIAAGYKDVAAQVLKIVERGLLGANTRYAMADAGLQLAQKDYVGAADALGTVVDSNSDLSPKALIQLIESRVSANQPIDIQTAELAGAYAQEYRRQVQGPELKRAHILALSEAGAYDLAFQELAQFSASGGAGITSMRSQAMKALSKNAGDPGFLKHALRVGDPQTTNIDAPSANLVAERLIDLGFPEQADVFLRPGADAAIGKARRLLRARAALAQMKPRRAEADLLGLSGPEVEMLRAEARSMSGDHAVATQLFADQGNAPKALEQAWLAKDWVALRESGDALWQDLALIVEPPTIQTLPPTNSGVLAGNRALLETSANARETLNGLLSRYSLDHAPEVSK